MSTREDQISDKCDQAGCDDKARKRHRQLFVYERWDVHPSQDFIDWLRKFHPNATNRVAAWNSDPTRQEYFEWVAIGQPGPVPGPAFNIKDAMADFRASMAKIESRVSRGAGGPVFEDQRRKGYDKRKGRSG